MTNRVLLLGYFGAGNLGDDMLLAAWLLRHQELMAQSRCDIDITVANDYDPFAALPKDAGITTDSITIVNKRQLIMGALDDYAALVAPGGSLLQDATSVRSLLYYLWVIHRFSSLGKPVFLLNQGLGPVSSFFGHYALRHVITGVNFISLRDEDSLRLLNKYVQARAKTRVMLSSDPLVIPLGATGIRPTAPEYLLLIPKETRDLPYPGDPIPEPQAVARFIDHASRESGLPVKLLAFHAGQDADYCRLVATASGAEPLQLELGADGVADYYRVFSRAGAVISYRLHGLITSASLHIPAFGVAYDRKIVSFSDAFSLPYCYPAYIHTTQTHDDFSRLWASHDEIKPILASKADEAAGIYERASREFAATFADLLPC